MRVIRCGGGVACWRLTHACITGGFGSPLFHHPSADPPGGGGKGARPCQTLLATCQAAPPRCFSTVCLQQQVESPCMLPQTPHPSPSHLSVALMMMSFNGHTRRSPCSCPLECISLLSFTTRDSRPVAVPGEGKGSCKVWQARAWHLPTARRGDGRWAPTARTRSSPSRMSVLRERSCASSTRMQLYCESRKSFCSSLQAVLSFLANGQAARRRKALRPRAQGDCHVAAPCRAQRRDSGGCPRRRRELRRRPLSPTCTVHARSHTSEGCHPS